MRNEDTELIEKLWEDLDAYFHVFYRKYWSPVFAWVFSKIRHYQNAEDITSQVFIAAYYDLMRRIDNNDSRELQLKPWLYKIANNKCINFIKISSQAHQSIDMPDVMGIVESDPSMQDMSAEERAEWREDAKEMCILLDQLPDHERDVLALRYIFDMNYIVIAKIKRIKINTAKSHGHRGLKKLKKLINKRKQIYQEYSENKSIKIEEWLKHLIWLLNNSDI